MIAYEKLKTIGADLSLIASDHFEKWSIHTVEIERHQPQVDQKGLLQFASLTHWVLVYFAILG